MPNAALLGLSVLLSSAPADLALTSSSRYLTEGFAWAKATALSRVHPDNGGCYQAALPDRGGYCQRDYAHQVDGAALLGLHAENLAMLRAFARAQSAARGWFTLWEINYDGSPMACDYLDDQHFWRNTAGMFDLVNAAWRQYQWTANPALVEDEALAGFYRYTLVDFVAAHQRTPDGIVGATGGSGWDIACTYNEQPGIVLGLAADSLATQRAAYVAYANLHAAGGRREDARTWHDRAANLKRVFNERWVDPATGRFLRGYDHPDGQPQSAFGYETSWFIPYRELCEQGATADAFLDFIHESFQAKPSPNIEAWTYLPDVFYLWNQHERGWRYFQHVLDSRSSYPEVAFTVVSQVATRLMGVEPDAPNHAVTTLGRLPDEVAWAQLDHIRVGANDISVRHELGNRQTTLRNLAGPELVWHAAFAGAPETLLVDGRATAARREQWRGQPVAVVSLTVPRGQAVCVAAGEVGR